MKQVVTETWSSKVSVEITLSYQFDKDLVGKKEREEVVKIVDGNKIVKYWIKVANDPKNIDEDNVKRFKKKTKDELLSERKAVVWQARQSNAAKYREMVLRGETLFNCDSDECFEELPELKEEIDLSYLKKLQSLVW